VTPLEEGSGGRDHCHQQRLVCMGKKKTTITMGWMLAYYYDYYYLKIMAF